MTKKYVMLSMFLCLICSQTGWASEEEKPWKERAIEAGAMKTSGNTDTTQLNAAGILKYNQDRWGYGVKASATRASDRGVTTAQHYDAQTEVNYNFNKRIYVFLLIDYDRDPFSGIDFQLNESTGLGYHAVLAPPLLLDIEVGTGMRQTKIKNTLQASDVVGRLSFNLKWEINDHVSFIENIKTVVGKQGGVTNTETALLAKLNSHLSSKISLKTQTNSKPALGAKKTDTETAMLLKFSF